MADFVTEFNKRLGQYIDTKARATEFSQLQTDKQAQALNLARLFSIQKDIAARKKAAQSSSSSSSSSGIKFDPVLGNLTQPTLDLITKTGNDKKFMGIGLPHPHIWGIPNDTVDKWMGPLDETLVGASVQAPLMVAKTAMDLLARGSYGTAEASKERAQALDEGQNQFQAIPEALGGLWSGLTGKEKTGWGEVVEANANRGHLLPGITGGGKNLGSYLAYLNPATSPMNPMNMGIGENVDPFFKNHPTLAHALKVHQGFQGEVGMDPTNLAGGKVVGSIREGSLLKDFSMDAYRKIAQDAATESIQKHGLTAHFNRAPKYLQPEMDPLTGRPILDAAGNTTNKIAAVGKDAVAESINKSVDDTLLQTGGGATAGRIQGLPAAPYTIASNAGITFRKHIFQDTNDLINDVMTHIRNGQLYTKVEIAQLRKQPFMSEFFDDLLTKTKAAHSGRGYVDITDAFDDFVKNAPTHNLFDQVDGSIKHVNSLMENVVKDFQDNLYSKLEGVAYNSPGFHIGGKTFGLKKLGAAYAGHKPPLDFLKDVKYADQLIGRTPQIAQQVRSLGMRRYMDFHKEIVDFVKTYKVTKDERKALQEAITSGKPLSPRMDFLANFIKTKYKEMFQEEVDMGARKATDARPDNYVYNFYRGSDIRNKIQKYKTDNIQSYIKKTGLLPADHTAAAKALKFKPEEDAFRALLYRKMNSNKKLTKAWFNRDLIHNYGVMGQHLSPDLIRRMKLTKQYKDLMPTDIAKELDAMGKGHDWYLPNHINDVFDNFKKIISGNETTHLQGFVRLIDKWTRIFKTSATIPWTGFHIRNAIGDMFMSYLDGVRGKDVAFLTDFARKSKLDPNYTLDIAGKKYTFEELKKMFKDNASSGGYQPAELLGADKSATLSPGAPLQLARKGSEKREDLFRFNHFLKAFREELPKAIKETSNAQRAERKAIDAATYRVNKYLFDYTALTPVEQKVFRRIMPFYTYTRKAAPTLAESMFLHPSQFSKTQRFFLDNHEDGSYNDMLTPQYQQDIGYADMPGGNTGQPNILGGQFLPTDVLNRLTNFSSPKSFFQNIVSQVNPYVKAPFELAGGTSYFNDQPIDSSGGYFSDSMLPFVKPLEDTGALDKLPGFGPGHKHGWLEKTVGSRMGLGLPVNTVTEGEQTAAAYTLDKAIKDKLTGVNEQLTQKGFKLILSQRKGGTSFRIIREEDNEVMFETQDPNEAMARAKQLAG